MGGPAGPLASNGIHVIPPRPLRLQVLEDIAKFSFGSFVSGLGSFFNSYFGALVLGPALWGLWQGVKLIIQYGSNMHLGVLNAMHREVPILRGKGDTQEQLEVTRVAGSFGLSVGTVLSALIVLSTFLLELSPELKLSLRFVGVLVFVSYLNAYYGILLRAHNQFGVLSVMAGITGLGNLLSVALILLFGLTGFLTGQLLTMTAATAYGFSHSPANLAWRWDNRVLKGLVVVGFPIMLMNLSYFVFTTIDRLVILALLDTRALGYYSLGYLAFAPLMMLFSVSGTVLYTRFGEKYGQAESPAALQRYVALPVEKLAQGTAVLLGGLFLALPFLVQVFLPAYLPGLWAAQVLMVGLFFAGVSQVPGYMMLTVGKATTRLAILVGSFIINGSAAYLAVLLGFGLVGVAAGSIVGYLAFLVASTVSVMRSLEATAQGTAAVLVRVAAPLAYVVVLCLVLERVFLKGMGPGEEALWQTVLAEGLFVLLSVPLLRRALSVPGKGWIWSY